MSLSSVHTTSQGLVQLDWLPVDPQTVVYHVVQLCSICLQQVYYREGWLVTGLIVLMPSDHPVTVQC